MWHTLNACVQCLNHLLVAFFMHAIRYPELVRSVKKRNIPSEKNRGGERRYVERWVVT